MKLILFTVFKTQGQYYLKQNESTYLNLMLTATFGTVASEARAFEEIFLQDKKAAIIIELGSEYIKAGFAGEEGPRHVFPSVVAWNETYAYIGKEALSKSGELNLTYPIENGIIEDFEKMEKVLNYIFYEKLNVDPQEYNVMLTESPFNPKINRQNMLQILFDTFNVSGFYIANEDVLALYSAGKFTGIVVNIAESETHIVPVFDGYALPHSTLRMNLGGRGITDYLAKILSEERGHILTTDIARDIKEKLCYVAFDFDEEMKHSKSGTSKEATYELSDGNILTIDSERFRAPEVLFKPSLIGKGFAGIHEQVYQSIQKSDVDVRKDLYQNIVLVGRSTMFSGLPERLTKEVQKLAPQNISSKIKVISVPEREHSIWVGGSILSSISTFDTMWITKAEYEEVGPTIVHQKCF